MHPTASAPANDNQSPPSAGLLAILDLAGIVAARVHCTDPVLLVPYGMQSRASRGGALPSGAAR